MILDITPFFILNVPGQAYIMDGLFIYSLLLSRSERRLDLNFEVAYTQGIIGNFMYDDNYFISYMK